MMLCLAAVAMVLSVGFVGSAAGAGAASGDIIVIGDQVGLFSGSIANATGYNPYQPGPAAGVPTVTVDPAGHTVTLAVNDAGRAATITLAWPMRPGAWQFGLNQANPEQHATLTRAAEGCTFTSGTLDVHRAEVAPDGGVAVLSADVKGSCANYWGGPYAGAAVRIGDPDPARAVSIPRAQPASISTGALAGTVVRHQVSVRNDGGKPWKVSAVGTGSSSGWTPLFRVEAGSDCTGVTLAPGQQCSVWVSATAPTYFIYEHLVVTGDAAAILVVPLRLEGYPPVAPPTGASTLPGRLATTVSWEAPSSQPQVGYRLYDTTGGQRTRVASAGKAETSMIAPGSGARRLALVAANGQFAESPDVVLDVPAVTSEVVTNDVYAASVAFATDLPGARPRPTTAERVSLDPSRTRWVTGRRSNVSVCRVDTEVCTPVPGTATTSPATDPQDAVWLPDGTIAFIRGASPELRTLWVVRTDGSGLRKVSAIPDRWHLAAAPSGFEVIVRSTLGTGSVERVRLSDGLKIIVPGTSSVDDFTVSNRGLIVVERRIDMSATRGRRTTTVMNLDGSGARVLALPAGDNRNVTFDPTGTRLAFSLFTGEYEASVWVANADGSSARPLSSAISSWVIGLAWSVDNRATPTASLGGPTYSGPYATFAVGATDADDPVGSLRRECRLDAASAWTSCPATLVIKGLAAGNHTVYARVTDPSGRQSAIVSRTWPVVTRLSDFNRDGLTDLVTRDSLGRLWLYPGNGAGSFQTRRLIGTGWDIMTALVTPGDVTGDGNADILARDSLGRLWLYPGNGTTGLSVRRQIGSGWNIMNAMTNAGDINGAGRPDLLARDTAGVLWLYPLSGNAVFGARTRVGTGWNGYTIRGPGDFSGDGRADILARDTAGRLWLYRGNGAGRVAARTLAGTGWLGMTALVTPGNWDRATGNDLLARDTAGRLWFYPGNNAGGFGARRQIGTGWNLMTYVG